jgi:hypothetical protein
MRHSIAVIAIILALSVVVLPLGRPASEAAAQRAPAAASPGQSVENTAISAVEDYLILAPKLHEKVIQQALHDAALQGYRFAGAAICERAFTVMSRPKGWPGGARYEYFIVTTSRDSTLDKELTAAYQDGWRLRGLIAADATNSPWAPFLHLAVLEKEIGKSPGAEEIRLVHTRWNSTFEKWLQQAASEGFQLAGLSEDHWGLSAVMTRPDGAKPEPRFSYRITQKPDEVIAEGYRPARLFQSVIAGRAILEKDARMAPEKVALKLVSPWRKSTLIRQLEEAASGGFRLAAMDSFWNTLWIRYPDRAQTSYKYVLVEVDSEFRAIQWVTTLEGYSLVAVQADGGSYQLVFETPVTASIAEIGTRYGRPGR